MIAENSVADLPTMIARAEEFMRSGLIKAIRNGPTPKREGRGRDRGKGQAFEWLCRHVSFDEKKCLFWPFAKNNGHPGLLGYCGSNYKPTRLMCLLAHGAPPSDQHQACHTCGRGNKGCIHPQHLIWKTPSESRRDEFRNGQRKSYGRGGKITPAEAAEIRALRDTKLASEIAKMYGLSPHRIGEISRGNAYVRSRSFTPRNGRFYPRIKVAQQAYSLGGYASSEEAGAAYEAARKRARLGEPILPSAMVKPSIDDIRRWYRPPSQEIKFGDREGEAVIAVDPDQEQSVFIMHNALNELHPRVKKFVLIASDTGDLTEAAIAAGLSQAQVAMVLPRLKTFLGPLLR